MLVRAQLGDLVKCGKPSISFQIDHAIPKDPKKTIYIVC